MKSYNETVNNVFRRINEYETAQKKKRKIISRTVIGFCCAFMIVIIGIGSHNVIASSPRNNEQTESRQSNPGMDSEKTEDVCNTPGYIANSPYNAEPVLPPKQVIRSYPCSEPERYVLPKNGEILITKPLYYAMQEYEDSVLYEIEVYLLINGESYLDSEDELMQEYERISDAMKNSETMKNEHLGLSTYSDGNGQKSYMLLGVVSKNVIDSFPVSDRYGYYITLSGGTDECTAQEPNISVYNGKASQK